MHNFINVRVNKICEKVTPKRTIGNIFNFSNAKNIEFDVYYNFRWAIEKVNDYEDEDVFFAFLLIFFCIFFLFLKSVTYYLCHY